MLEDRVEGARAVDLFAGIGAFGLEAISRGARHVRFVEQSSRMAQILERNAATLSFTSQCSIDRADAFLVPDARALENGIDIAFLDPPFPFFRDAESTRRVFERVHELLTAGPKDHDPAVILRIPSGFRGEVPESPTQDRKYGQSRVLVYERDRTG